MIANGPSNSSASPGDSADGKTGGSNKTSIIVGVVVGVGGALILAAAAAWLWRRRKQKAHRQPEPEPYHVSEKDLYRSASWAPHNAPAWPDGAATFDTDGAPTGSDGERRRRVVQEQDAEEDVEYLPPRYREWHPDSSPDAPTDGTPPTAVARDGPVQRSSLKNDYVRALGGASESSGAQGSRSTATAPLKGDYARVFEGSAPSPGSAGEPSESSDGPTLKNEYVRAFGPRDGPSR